MSQCLYANKQRQCVRTFMLCFIGSLMANNAVSVPFDQAGRRSCVRASIRTCGSHAFTMLRECSDIKRIASEERRLRTDEVTDVYVLNHVERSRSHTADEGDRNTTENHYTHDHRKPHLVTHLCGIGSTGVEMCSPIEYRRPSYCSHKCERTSLKATVILCVYLVKMPNSRKVFSISMHTCSEFVHL